MLNFLEKKLKLDIRYFLGAGFWLSISHFSNIIKFLIMGVFFARFLSKDEFGIFTYINSIFLIANIFGAPGMSVAIMQSVSRGYEGTLAYLTKKVFLWSIMGSLFLFIFGLYEKFINNNSDFFIILFVLSLIFPFYSISLNFIYHLTALKKFRLRMWMELIQNLLIICAITIAILLHGKLFLLILIPIAVQTITGLLYLIYLIKSANKRIDFGANEYGKILNLSNVLPTAKMQLDKILIANFLGYSSLAIYGIAVALGDQIYAGAKIVASAIIPKSANLSQKILQNNFRKMLILLIILFSSFSIILFFIYPYVVPFVFGKQYMDVVFYARIITFFIVIKSVSMVLQHVSQSKKNLKSTMFLSYIGPFIELGLMLILIVKYQILGIIISKIISDTLNLAVVIFYFNKKEKQIT